MNKPSLKDMLEAGMHFGHQKSHWHPKMAEYIFGERSRVHIIDLEKTQAQLEQTLNFIKGIVERGGVVLFVATKKQAQPIVKAAAESCGMPYVTERWLGGTLTNYPQIKQTLRRLRTLKEQREKGELKKYTKKEQLMLDREIEEKEHLVGGIQYMERVPEAVFVVDVRHEKTAVAEASKVGAKVIGLCDTNSNPTLIDYVIPANDDAVKSIKLVTALISEVILEGKAQAAKVAAAAPRAKSAE